jgi:CPA2 family monovalent cation:H+ antiporter-2
MHMDPMMPVLVAALLGILLVALLLRWLGQPHVIGYLLAGMVLGPQGLGLVTDEVVLERLGDMGVVLLLFFIGMEVSPRDLVRGWRVAVIGTLVQVAVGVGGVWLVGLWLGWPPPLAVLMGFIISLSSTAVVLKLLADQGELGTHVGRGVLGVLLAQDVALIPMLVAVAAMGDGGVSRGALLLQGVGALAVLAVLWAVFRRGAVALPLPALVRRDHEFQVFTALVLCFGLALITALLGLSTALGAFVAGILVGAAPDTEWVKETLAPFRVVFVALFFVSVGMLVDLGFVRDEWPVVLLLVVLVVATKTLINAGILRLLRDPWRQSFYAGALLAQIGEFSFVLAAVGLQAGLLETFGYQLAVAVISLSLLASPPWIRLVRALTGYRPPPRTTSAT